MAVNDRMRSRSQHSKQKILPPGRIFAIAGFFDGLILALYYSYYCSIFPHLAGTMGHCMPFLAARVST